MPYENVVLSENGMKIRWKYGCSAMPKIVSKSGFID